MDSNELNRRVRYALSLDDADVVDIMRMSVYKPNAEQVASWRLKEGEPGFIACPPDAAHTFLDGLIIRNRGAREDDATASGQTQSKPEAQRKFIDNNEALKQLRIALSLKTNEVHELIVLGGGKLTNSEVNALFRKPDARNYRRCGDQVLRWFLVGLAQRRNTV